MTHAVLVWLAVVSLPLAGASLGSRWANRRWRTAVRAMWNDLGGRAQDHGPLAAEEVAEVLERWLGDS